MIEVLVKANSKEDKIELVDGIYKVNLKAKAKDNEANISLIKLFKKKLGINVRIVRGFRNKRKLLELY